MNKPNIWIATAIVMVIGTTFLGFQSAVAQYAGSSNLEEELKLAQEKVSNAGQEGAYGSGTSMLSADISQTAHFYNNTSSNIRWSCRCILCYE